MSASSLSLMVETIGPAGCIGGGILFVSGLLYPKSLPGRERLKVAGAGLALMLATGTAHYAAKRMLEPTVSSAATPQP